MARERSSFGEQDVRDAGRRADPNTLTPAEAHALSRSAPLTPAQFKAIGRTAALRTDALRSVLNAEAERGVRRAQGRVRDEPDQALVRPGWTAT